MALKNYKSFPLLKEYLNYLLVIKGRSRGTITPYRTDLLMFFQFRGERQSVKQEKYDLSNINADYIQAISLSDNYHLCRKSLQFAQIRAFLQAFWYDNAKNL